MKTSTHEESSKKSTRHSLAPAGGNIVTHAKGGESLHNFGKAFDVVQIKNGTPIWNKLSDEIVSIGNELGLKWGGHWNTFKDYPHFYIK